MVDSEFYNPDVRQAYPDTCAIKSQQLILNDYGIDVSENDLLNAAIINGWYHVGGGTMAQDVGKLLEAANIPVTRQEGANVFNLINELAQGHKVIVGLDANELWYNDSVGGKLKNWLDDFWGEQYGNHALIVAGIDTSDPDNIQVIVRDPGSGEDGKPYPLEQFMDAWSDAHCYMVSTDIPASAAEDAMRNFDYGLGHVSEIAGVNYTDFQVFNDISMGLPKWVPLDTGGFESPVSSLTRAYFDYANNVIDFNGIFSGDYAFNKYLDHEIVNDCMSSTLFNGFNCIDWNALPQMDYDIPVDFTPDMLAGMGVDYDMFYKDCMEQFCNMGDSNSMNLCQQQLDIIGYCDNNAMDYSDFLV